MSSCNGGRDNLRHQAVTLVGIRDAGISDKTGLDGLGRSLGNKMSWKQIGDTTLVGNRTLRPDSFSVIDTGFPPMAASAAPAEKWSGQAPTRFRVYVAATNQRRSVAAPPPTPEIVSVWGACQVVAHRATTGYHILASSMMSVGRAAGSSAWLELEPWTVPVWKGHTRCEPSRSRDNGFGRSSTTMISLTPNRRTSLTPVRTDRKPLGVRS
jgi:hypothetical protein